MSPPNCQVPTSRSHVTGIAISAKSLSQSHMTLSPRAPRCRVNGFGIMQRLTPKRRTHFIRRATYESRRRLRRKLLRHGHGYSYIRPIVVTFTGDLDLIDNAASTRDQFFRLERAAERVRGGRVVKIFVDLRGVTSLEACALVYLAALVDDVGRHRGLKVRGNWPNAPLALKAMLDAKFHEFMGMRLPKQTRRWGRQAPPTLHLMRGRSAAQLDPRYWGQLPRYLRTHGALSEEDADDFYNAFGECVENVQHHAYGKGSGVWYGVAIRPSPAMPARAVVLDLGVGIPRTIRRTPEDRLRSRFAIIIGAVRAALAFINLVNADDDDDADEVDSLLARAESDDWMCILLATLGLRTQTSEAGRGTGLRWLRETVLERQQGALHVLSGESGVTWRYGEPPRPDKLTPLLGTIVCLEIGQDERPGDDNV